MSVVVAPPLGVLPWQSLHSLRTEATSHGSPVGAATFGVSTVSPGVSLSVFVPSSTAALGPRVLSTGLPV